MGFPVKGMPPVMQDTPSQSDNSFLRPWSNSASVSTRSPIVTAESAKLAMIEGHRNHSSPDSLQQHALHLFGTQFGALGEDGAMRGGSALFSSQHETQRDIMARRVEASYHATMQPIGERRNSKMERRDYDDSSAISSPTDLGTVWPMWGFICADARESHKSLDRAQDSFIDRSLIAQRHTERISNLFEGNHEQRAHPQETPETQIPRGLSSMLEEILFDGN